MHCSIPMRRVTGVDWEPGVRYRTEYNDGAACWYNRGISTRVPVGTDFFFQNVPISLLFIVYRAFCLWVQWPRCGAEGSAPSGAKQKKAWFYPHFPSSVHGVVSMLTRCRASSASPCIHLVHGLSSLCLPHGSLDGRNFCVVFEWSVD